MSPAAAFHAQLASIMEVLANTAVAEICELVDSGYSVLQRKLRLMELRAARATALRAAATAGGTALLLAGGRARAQLPAHHPGNGPRRSGTPGAEPTRSTASNQETLRCRDPDPSSDSGQDTTQGTPSAGDSTELTTAVIKVEEDDDESWSQPEPDKVFCHVVDGPTTETEAPPPLTKQEAADDSGGSSQSWASGEVSSTSTSVQKTLSGQRPDAGSYECLIYEPQLQHAALTSQNALSEDPGCSYVLNTSVSASADSGGGSFPFSISEAAERQQPAGFQSGQQRAPPPADEPARKEVTERVGAFVRRDRWRPQDGVSRASGHSREDGGGKAFVCNCCGKTLACLKNLKTHMRVHTGEKPFVCALCGKRFSDSSNLKRHQSVHTGEKRYGCVHCGKRFAQSGSLKVHMTVHTDCKQFRCSYCGKTFISGSHLRRHVTVHAGEKRFAPTFQ
ncbi:zinc finger protein 287-like [Plectropomus leopardus]|uniref:zinc finger protein 287-like n=1 Tax=Plectropomus leopardus TaxID=160734 RepID=UPI001C4C88B7|nr:zinc finger protein 287-like [Plectropomus leopardus]